MSNVGAKIKPLVVVGGGGHAKVVISILKKLKEYHVLGYTDTRDNDALLGIRYLGPDNTLQELTATTKDLHIVIAVGQVGLGKPREQLEARLETLSLQFPVIISPDAVVNEGVILGEGAVIMDGAVVNAGAAIGRGVIVNTNATVEHDANLGKWVHVGPGATLSGGVSVGAYSMIGVGATVIQSLKIAEGCIVGAGAVVTKDLTESGVYVGAPARRIK